MRSRVAEPARVVVLKMSRGRPPPDAAAAATASSISWYVRTGASAFPPTGHLFRI
jgi:hypothetical protein